MTPNVLMFHDGALVRPVSRMWWESDRSPVPVASGTATVTAHTTAHTMGPWTELVAATAADADCVRVTVTGVGVSGVNTATLVDVGVGAAGAEVAVAAGVPVGGASATSTQPIAFDLPVYVPAGTRIAARIQSVVTGGKTASVTVTVTSSARPALAGASVDVLGASTATSSGVALTTAGAWVEVVASSPRAYRAVGLVPSINSGAVPATVNSTLSVGIGAAGAEVVLASIRLVRSSAEVCYRSWVDLTSLQGAYIPAGTRIALRDSDGGAGCAGTLIGVPA